MKNESNDMTSAASAISIEANTLSNPEFEINQEQRYRASAYGLLAGILRAAPDQVMLDRLSGLGNAGEEESDDLMLAMSTSSGTSRIVGWHSRPASSRWRGLIGKTLPA